MKSSMMKRIFAITAFSTGVAFGLGQAAQAATFTETTDAGETLGTAIDLSTFFAPGSNQIEGANNQPGDSGVDLFKIFVTGGAFSASTVETSGTISDTQLFLFDANGRGVLANDDAVNNVARSTISATLAAGIYYLALSGFNRDPQTAGDLIFPDITLGLLNPTSPGGVSPLASWSGQVSDSGRGTYTINLTGVSAIPTPNLTGVSAIPTPALLPGLVGFGVAALRKRKAVALESANEA